jgi:hypothetical protein
VNLLIKHVLSALYPKTEHFPGITEMDLDGFLRRFRREAAGLMRLGFYAAVFLFLVTPILTVYVPLPSFLLPRRLLDRHAERLASFPLYPLRSLIFLLKLVAGLCWGAHPLVRERFALPPLPPDPEQWRTT